MIITIKFKDNHIFTKIETESSPPAFFKGSSKIDILVDKKLLISVESFTYSIYLVSLKVDEKTNKIELLSFEYYEPYDDKYRKQDFTWNEFESWNETENIKSRKDIGFFEINWTDKLRITLSKLPEVN
jgi:sporulation-control protein spo0M